MMEEQQQRHYQSTTSSSSNGHSTHERTNAMPADEREILAAFEDVLKQMDLPPDKIRTLREVDLKKKWNLVCDQRQFSVDHSVTDPAVYLEKLKLHMDKKAMKKKKKALAGETSTSLLKHIEISLRTNTIDWVRLFLAPETDGLKVLVDYISYLQDSFFTILLRTSSDYYENGVGPSSSSAGLEGSLNPPVIQFSSADNAQQQFTQNGQQFFSASGSSASSLQTAMNASIHSAADNSALKATNTSSFWKSSTAKSNGKAAGKQLPQTDSVDDDIHVGISCLRALLNNKFGITAVFANRPAIYCIVRAILHPSPRTKALAFDLLSGIVSLTDGHELVLGAFNKFRMDYGEATRFQTLVHCFKCHNASVDFLSSCIKFVNVLVHSPADMNQRVALQYEFTCLGLDKYLEEINTEFPESEFLLNHVNLYWENCIDVELLHDKSMKCDELEQEVHSLQAECSRQKEDYQVLKADCYVQIAQLNAQTRKLAEEKIELERQKVSRDTKISTLTKDWRERETKFESEKGELEKRIALLEQAKKEIQHSLKVAQQTPAIPSPKPVTTAKSNSNNNNSSIGSTPQQNNKELPHKAKANSAPPPPPPPPAPNFLPSKQPFAAATNAAPPPPPPPPPPPSMAIRSKLPATGGGPPPPPPGLLSNLANNINGEPLPKKRIAVTKNNLPMLNWSALNPNQVKGTVFNELNDEKLVDVLDLSKLEEFFGAEGKQQRSSQQQQLMEETDKASAQPAQMPLTNLGAGSGKTTLLGTKRLQNIAIIRRKLGKSIMEIMSAVHRFDLSILGPDQVDILLPIVPTQEEVTKLRDYAAQHNNSFELLTIEDQFLAELVGIERLTQKLLIMKFMGEFEESVKLLIPQLQKVTAAAKSVHDAKKFPKVMEVILAVGNAMNGSKRAPVYGFRISSFDSLSILKSPKDRNVTLLHCIVELIVEKFPNLLDFSAELKLAESAATVNMETISSDVRDIETKFAQAMTEQKRKGREETPALLNAFLDVAVEKVQTLQEQFKLAQEAFAECAEYFGEVPGRVQPDAFFARLTSFCKHFEQALAENETKKKAEQRQEDQQKRRSAQMQRRLGNAVGKSPSGNEQLLDELNAKFVQCLNGSQGSGPRNKALRSSNINDGDFERIMVGLKEGFVAPNAAPPVVARRKKSPSPNREKLNGSREQERSTS